MSILAIIALEFAAAQMWSYSEIDAFAMRVKLPVHIIVFGAWSPKRPPIRPTVKW